MPSQNVRMISSLVQAPIPVSRSGVILVAYVVNGFSSHVSPPESSLSLNGPAGAVVTTAARDDALHEVGAAFQKRFRGGPDRGGDRNHQRQHRHE
jgi:hypothetical protein